MGCPCLFQVRACDRTLDWPLSGLFHDIAKDTLPQVSTFLSRPLCLPVSLGRPRVDSSPHGSYNIRWLPRPIL